MHISSIAVQNFRNYDTVKVNFDTGVQIFSGDNAQGKTNLLEALFLPVMGKSFRATNEDEMIRWGQKGAMVEVLFSNRVAENQVQFIFQREQHKQVLLNGRKIRPKELVGRMNMVLFCPEDLLLVKGAPALRRRFLDLQLSQTDPQYYSGLLDYNRILFQRNHLLKKIRDEGTAEKVLDAWDESYCKIARLLILKRLSYLNRLTKLADEIHQHIANGNEQLSSQYRIHGCDEAKENIPKDEYEKLLLGQRRRDILRGTTEMGPHKDDITFNINGKDVRAFASQGQQRTLVLSSKLAELELIRQETGEYPVLLLDDVMSELDALRRSKLVSAIEGKVQCFITGTEGMESFAEFHPRWYYIQDGQIEIGLSNA